MIQQIQFASRITWDDLIKRPQLENDQLENDVRQILLKVKENGDSALFEYSKLFDNMILKELEVSQKEIQNAVVSDDLKEAIQVASKNIEKFHAHQVYQEEKIEVVEGVLCWRENRPIEKVGIYIPGGSAPLFSTVLMLGIPAKLAGCEEVILCTPPGKNGEINSAILYTAQLLGIDKVFKVGGAQAIAAMTFGTETIPAVDKVFGPGNQYVTKAKELARNEGIAIDMPAGPSEVLIIADESCNPGFVAADLLSQAEHGEDSQVVLLSNNEQTIDEVIEQLVVQHTILPRKRVAEQALKKSWAIQFESIDECMEFSNVYAPEHLILAIRNSVELVGKVRNAGSVFLGNYSCESAGDYASGPNHTLPTNGYARNHSGVSVESFQKKISFQQLSKKGIRNIGPAIEKMAEMEQLEAHKNAVTIRLNFLENESN